MRTLILVWFIAIAALSARSEPLPDAVAEKLTAAILEVCPEANIQVTNNVFTAKHGTTTFTLHARSKRGEIFPQTYEAEGPNFRGFLLSVGYHAGKYQGAAVVPQTMQEPYFSTFLDAPQAEDGRHYYLVRFSFGGALDEKIRSNIFATIPRSSLGYSTGTIFPARQAFAFREVSLSETQRQNLDAALRNLEQHRAGAFRCENLNQAAALLSESLSIAATTARAAAEYRGFFVFSRLDWAREDDGSFLSGFGVKRSTGDIYRWEQAARPAPNLTPMPDLTPPSEADTDQVNAMRTAAGEWWTKHVGLLAEESFRVAGHFQVAREMPRLADRDKRIWEVRVIHLNTGTPTGVLWISEQTRTVASLSPAFEDRNTGNTRLAQRIETSDSPGPEQKPAGSFTLPDSPARLIQILKGSGTRCYVSERRLDYVKASDIPRLMELLNSTEPCAFVDDAESSISYPGRSTVGHEAAYLIEGFQKRYYPTRLTSQEYKPDIEEIKRWYRGWTQLQKLEIDSPAPIHPVSSTPQTAQPLPRFALYLLKTPHADLANAELETQPLVTEKDVVTYNWQTHTMCLTEAGRKKIPGAASVGTGGREFVVVADGQRCYRAAFWTPYSSVGWSNPVIDVTQAGTTIRIERAYPPGAQVSGTDPRADERIHRVLQALGKISD